MNLTLCLILLGILVFWGFSSVVSGLRRIQSALYLIVDGLAEIYKLLQPLTEEARKREREAAEARRSDIQAFSDATEAGSRGLTIEGYWKLQADAKAVGLTVEEYEAKQTEAGPKGEA
jgi:hypothetical protein